MAEFDYKRLDEVIHSRIRLGIMSLLYSYVDAEFTFIRDKIETTDGNASVHLKKLEEAGYVSVTKSFVNRKPRSEYRLTRKGRGAFERYVRELEHLINERRP